MKGRGGSEGEQDAPAGGTAVKDIFISYASEDRLAAGKLADALIRQGWSVWWDPDIPPGHIWDELIEQELAAVRCVVVLWSASSVGKQWVKAEAAEAAARGILVPALIEDVKPPLAFRQIEAARLCDWCGELEHREFQQLLGTVSRLVHAHVPAGIAPGQRERAVFLPHQAARPAIAGQGSAKVKASPSPPRASLPRPALAAAASRTPSLSRQPDVLSPRWRKPAMVAALVVLGGTCGFFARDMYELSARTWRLATPIAGGTVNPADGCTAAQR